LSPYIPTFRQTCRTKCSSASGCSSLSGLLSNPCQKGRDNPQLFTLAPRFRCKLRHFFSALGRTRTCDLLIHSPSPPKPQGDSRDREGQNRTFIRHHELTKGRVPRTRRARSWSGRCHNLQTSLRISVCWHRQFLASNQQREKKALEAVMNSIRNGLGMRKTDNCGGASSPSGRAGSRC
jgi:hypothetical protein